MYKPILITFFTTSVLMFYPLDFTEASAMSQPNTSQNANYEIQIQNKNEAANDFSDPFWDETDEPEDMYLLQNPDNSVFKFKGETNQVKEYNKFKEDLFKFYITQRILKLRNDMLKIDPSLDDVD